MINTVLAFGIFVSVYPVMNPLSNADVPIVAASAQTQALPRSGDAADDPAIWVHPADGSKSLIIGTDKQGGLGVYRLDGTLAQMLPDGRMNNVDVAHNVRLADGTTSDLIFASKRDDDTIAAYQVDRAKGTLAPLPGGPFPASVTGVYGLCAFVDPASGLATVVTNSKDGTVVFTEFSSSAEGRFSTRMTRSFCVGTQVEGCVVDVPNGRVYVGEECVGLWNYPLRPEALKEGEPARTLLDSVKSIGSGKLAPDVEGVTIYELPAGKGWIIVSCQSEDRYAVYERLSGKHIGSFGIEFAPVNAPVDRVTHTDGLSAISRPLGPEYPEGALVVQDDNGGEGQNFKIVDWRRIAKALSLRP